MQGTPQTRLATLALLVAAALSCPAPASADEADIPAGELAEAPIRPARVDPLLRPGVRPPEGTPGISALDEDGPRAALLTAPGLSLESMTGLEARDLAFRHDRDGAPIHIGGVYPVDGELELLVELAGQGLDLALARSLDAAIPMTAVTGPASELDALVASGPSPVDGPSGLGLAVLDMDSSIDPFHPHFFRADGGRTIWWDADGDGVLTPGVDGVDRNGDGLLADDEVLRIAQHRRLWSDPVSGSSMDEGLDDGFDPSRDWLWTDDDGDGLRDFGPEAGFDDSDRGFGERMYVPDDVDGDGRIEVPERIFRLGTSRIAAVLTPSHTFRRGEDLTEYAFQPFYRQDHGTGVGGALVGGQLHPQPRPRGLLPEADLYLFDRTLADQADMVEALYEARDEGVDVVLWEFGQWTLTHLDGSSPVEAAIDELSAGGMVQVCPAGNLSDSGKHGSTTSIDGELAFHVRASTWVAQSIEGLWIDLHTADAPVELACRLTSPGGEEIAIDWSGYAPDIAGLDAWSSLWESGRDTTLWSISLQGSVEPGTWVLRCDDAGGGSHDFHAYLADGYGWSRGAWFLQDDPTSTLCHPSTADACVSVAAFGATTPYWDGEAVGERHLYSSVGPRIDDGKTIDVTAPADPFVPAPLADVAEDFPNDPPYRLFGGTSGAGPHVAAAALLLKELDPDTDGEEVRQQLRDGARVDSFVAAEADTFPDDAWGWGKLSAYASAYGESPPAPPFAPVEVTVDLAAVRKDGETCTVTGTATVAGHEDARVRWDLGYDGDWTSGFQAAPIEFEMAPDEVTVIRAQAAADGWWVGGEAVIYRAPDPCPRGCASCRSGVAGGGASWLVALVALAMRRRRDR